MEKRKKLLSLLKNPLWMVVFLNNRGFHFLDDYKYISLLYKLSMKKVLNLDDPITYNEKLQWLKLYDRKDIYTKMVDKSEVKEIIAEKIGKEYVIPTLGLYDKFEDIDFDKLPNQFVIKCTHDSGGLVIVRDKSKINIKTIKKKIKKCLKKNFYWSGREWPYKNVVPRIIIEKYMEDKEDNELRDYKFFCFNGKCKLMFIASNRQGKGDTYFDFFDEKFNHLDIVNGHPNALIPPHKPKHFNEMIKMAEKISKNIPQVRIDFYEVNNEIYFGEITFFHYSGFVPFIPDEWDKIIGEWIKLPTK